MNNFYVYALLNSAKNFEPFYIGMGQKKRVKAHFLDSQLKQKSHKNNTIKKYRDLGYADAPLIIEENLTKEHAEFLEIYYIAHFGRADCNEGILTNNTDGGSNPSDRDKIFYKVSKKYNTYWTEGRLKSLSVRRELFIKNNTGVNNPISKLAKEGKHPATLAAKDPTKQWFRGEKSNLYGIPAWNSNMCTELSLITWRLADDIYSIHCDNTSLGAILLKKLVETELNVVLARKATITMLSKFKSGWIPSQDFKWLEFNLHKLHCLLHYHYK